MPIPNKFITFLLMGLFFSFGCNSCNPFAIQKTTTYHPEPTLPPQIQDDWARITGLMYRTIDPADEPNLAPNNVEISSKEVGAVTATGFVAGEPEVTVTIYFFASATEHEGAIEKLKDLYDLSEDTILVTGSNGRVLFFGYTEKNSDLLNRFATAFEEG